MTGTNLACCLSGERGGPSSEHLWVPPPTGRPVCAAEGSWSYRAPTRPPTNTPITLTRADLEDLTAFMPLVVVWNALFCSSRLTRPSIPGKRLISQLNCFFEMLVQLRSRESGWRRIIPLSISGVTEVQRLRSMVVQSLLSQHLQAQRTMRKMKSQREANGGIQRWFCVAALEARDMPTERIYHLFHVLQILMQTHSSWCARCPKIFIQTSRWITWVLPSFRGSLSGGGLMGGGRMTCRSIWMHFGGECGGAGRLVGVLLLKPRGVIWLG